MNERDKEKIITRYSERLNKYGYSAETLGWGKKDRRNLRFHILASQWNMNGNSVLDFGCGFGDFYAYAEHAGLEIDYTGVDINPDLIAEAKRVYPHLKLYSADIFQEELPAKNYDYIISSGTHNTKIENNEAFIENTFAAFNKYAKKGFALNFISNKAEIKYPDVYYSDPAYILGLCYKYSIRIVLRNDYMPFEFTVFVNKEQDFDPANAVYPDFIKYL
jgi:SAM-dependent methyltransferase